MRLPMSAFSNRPVWVKRFHTIHCCQLSMSPRARASLRNRLPGPFHFMGFENEK